MKKKILLIVLAALLLVGGVCAGVYQYRSSHVFLGEQIVTQEVTELDLSGTKNPDIGELSRLTGLKKLNLRDTEISVADYEALKNALPDCQIQWQVPFQGGFLEPDTKELTVTSLTLEDLSSIRHLPALERVYAEGCGELELLNELREENPDVTVEYTVPIDGRNIDWDVTELMIVGPDVEEVDRQLAYLPKLKKLVLTGDHPGNDALWELEKAHPDITVVWNVDVLGKLCLNTAKEVDLTGVQVEDFRDVEEVVKYFPNMEKLNLSHCGRSNEELKAFKDKHPEWGVVWSVKIRFFYVRTDAKYLMPYQYGCTVLLNEDAESLKYLTELECIDIGHMGITDLSFLYYMPNVKYLIIADCGIWDITPVGSLKKLEYLEMFLNDIRDISPLAGCTELRDINMCYNFVSDTSALMELEHLEHMWMKGNYITWEQGQKLQKKFPDAKIVLYSKNISSTAEGWRKIPRYYAQRDYMGMWYTIEE